VVVGIVMGSKSDWPTMEAAAKVLDELGSRMKRRLSPRTALQTGRCSTRERKSRGLRVIIAGAGERRIWRISGGQDKLAGAGRAE